MRPNCVRLDRMDRDSSSSLYSLAEMKSERTENYARVYELLRGIEIVPNELDRLELPVTVEVMKEQIDFFHKLGLTIEDINNYPLVLGYLNAEPEKLVSWPVEALRSACKHLNASRAIETTSSASRSRTLEGEMLI
ncbi:hypothetical protein NL676_008254 [Syzygium grande]|nr:hypothetical protein NL676_008254 [Syzygium grande]